MCKKAAKTYLINSKKVKILLSRFFFQTLWLGMFLFGVFVLRQVLVCRPNWSQIYCVVRADLVLRIPLILCF